MLKLRILFTASFALVPALALAQTHSQGGLPHRQQAQNIGGCGAELIRKSSDVRLYIVRLVERQLLAIPGVTAVHDVHVSVAASGIDAMSAHLVVVNMAQAERILTDARRILANELDADHVTIQVETEALRAAEKPQKA
ncbi:hypothetical protein [Methylobacterium isbiliense]|uniref:Cation efflux protein cytoplasmic domain-containing protein n=1 Tax=Methylobacterium isbiliense TaxID=315478 RepID=A0ABQ4S8J5_9HYPH|nr:hypothetical protein [Methylobacterium isbiliense]MDN3626956.1 hypothetical protein [Methylobacterium isbiliense]GJD98770.1 hypothetical protein GMJLKIPL_0681 [Methylobacterium isbiliense]